MIYNNAQAVNGTAKGIFAGISGVMPGRKWVMINGTQTVRERFMQEIGASEAEIGQRLAVLAKREFEVIKLRWGLAEDGNPLTVEEVGKIFKITRERVREIEAKAMRKLKGQQ